MRHLRLGLLICAVLVSTTTVVGQGTSGAPSTSDPQAVALLQRSAAVLTGGFPVSDVTLTGSAHRIEGSDDETGTATLKATVAGDSRVDLSFPSGNRRELRNHAAMPLPGVVPPNAPASAQGPQPVGARSGPDGVLHPLAANNLLTDATWFVPALTVSRLTTSQRYVLSYLGQETLNGQAVLHISATQQFRNLGSGPAGIVKLLQHLSQTDIYLDPTSLLPVAMAFNTHPDNNAMVDIPTEIQFLGYQTVTGVQVPFHVQKYVNGGLVLDLQLTNATLNSGVANAQFQLQ